MKRLPVYMRWYITFPIGALSSPLRDYIDNSSTSSEYFGAAVSMIGGALIIVAIMDFIQSIGSNK